MPNSHLHFCNYLVIITSSLDFFSYLFIGYKVGEEFTFRENKYVEIFY